ncbi:MAG: isoprenylcysteine carboxylmethyltransferase family protein [Chloroflexi bacterium]|nr:isoprenylcysteine carboxylmethyltransferase family protein [Chloroflexota bacterium]MCI0580644.1 isoprenylcysteine carboxylmethyltransferase family protein [Chloroflexota bacterium]MCI0648660.1 isoprenylcysteine carboxylmethyltransferase family protein [Chloroflexota bacterium]MCI0728068.1 isoprenylcysteine carboxylmethyltransferase family protein [Chloroflexota bacterium]
MSLFLKNLLFTIFVPGTAAVLLPFLIVANRPEGLATRWGLQQYLALLPLLLGAAIYLHCVYGFAVLGRGTPAPFDAPKQLVVRGLYRYVRNPMYIGVLLVTAGWALLFNAWPVLVYALGLSLAFHLFVVLIEEPSLRRQFGLSYEQYCRAVRRWLPGPPYEPSNNRS